MSKKVSGIYVIVNTKNGKVYVGQAQKVSIRWTTHKRELKLGKHYNTHLQAAWDLYGEKSFVFRILEHCPIEQLNSREQHHIDIYMAKGLCYNVSKDVLAPTRGLKHSAESIAKIVAKTRGQKRSPEQIKRNREVHTGVKLSAETRRKMSEVRKGKGKPPFSEEHRRKIGEAVKKRPPISEETRRKISEAGKTRKQSKETRRKIGDSKIGKKRAPFSEEARHNMSEGQKGRKHSDETLRKLSEAHKNRPPASEETRRKMSESQKRRRALKKALNQPIKPPDTNEPTE